MEFWRFQVPKEAVSPRRLTGDIYPCAHIDSFQAAVRTLVINMHTQPVVQTLVIASRSKEKENQDNAERRGGGRNQTMKAFLSH